MIFLSETNVFPDSIPQNLITQNFGAGYAVMVVDESQNYRLIRETLAGGGLDAFISESSQEIPIDDFGFLRMIPLYSFRDYIEPFDPRDTGYAEMLRSFFVRHGQRFFFLPLEDTAGRKAANLYRQVAALLPDIPFTLTILGQNRSFFWYFALLAAASVSALFISRSRRLFALYLPVLLAFGWNGFSAFVLAAALAGILELLREPMGELSAARRYQRNGYAGFGISGLWEKLKPFRLNFAMLLLFLVFLAVYSVMAALPPIPLIMALAVLGLLYFLAFRADSERARKSRHVPFIPVPLLPFKAKTFSLFPLLLPFAAASVLTVFLPLVLALPGISPARGNGPPIDTQYLVSREDYYRHVDFQRSFSFRRLDQPRFEAGAGQWALIQEPFMRYYLGEDGLIAGSTGYAINMWAVAPFPLEKLMDFLLHYDTAPVRGTSSFALKEWFSVSFILAALIVNWFPTAVRPAMRPWSGKTNSKKVPVSGDKRMVA